MIGDIIVAMEYRELGRTGWKISAIGFGAWAIGGDEWGGTDDAASMRALHRAVELGINFFDTADIYGDGHSERLIAQLRRERREALIVATKAGRRLHPHVADGYNGTNLTRFVERSLKNLDTDALDLLQLHCPPPHVYDRPEVFGVLDDLERAGKLKFYGVSVETVDEAIRAIEYRGVQSVQIIFNMFRFKPADRFLKLASERRVGVLARVPLASGLLTGKLRRDSKFPDTDHRHFNRHGEAFDVGETFSGVDYDTGIRAAEELGAIVPNGATLAQAALRWILDFPEVTAAIPGARNAAQVESNVGAAGLPPLSDDARAVVRAVYDRHFRAAVHHRW